jgi:DNA-binding HxlR family transcriptional regulator
VRRVEWRETCGHAASSGLRFQKSPLAQYASDIEARRHPISQLLDLLGRRWALRVLWELRGDPLPYGQLRAACDEVSTSVLAQRLRELQDAGVVETTDGRYGLTRRGRELTTLLGPLNDFARRWARR